MIVKPLIPKSFLQENGHPRSSTGNIEIVRRCEVWDERMMEDYVEETTRITGLISEENSKHSNVIETTQKKIDDNQIIIDCLRSNLMVTLDGNN